MAVKTTAGAARAAKDRSVRPGDADFYRGDAYTIHDSVGYLLRQLRSALDRVVDAEMDEHDLTGVQWGPLLMLHFRMGTTAAELARAACVDTGAMTRMLDRLEAKGLLKRTPCARDRRVFQLGVSSSICSLVVQRKLGTTLRRSATFHWKVKSTAVMTTNPSTTAIQSSVRQYRVTEGDAAGAAAPAGWVRA